VRPLPATGDWTTCDKDYTPTAHQDWYEVVQGSLVVQLASQDIPQVVHANLPCAVGWDDASWFVDSAGGCDVQNMMTPDGGYRLTLHGQIPADQMGTPSVRRFTPDGKMTDVCEKSR
jgi:hypothetical protein